jgi:hypothetical protein
MLFLVLIYLDIHYIIHIKKKLLKTETDEVR